MKQRVSVLQLLMLLTACNLDSGGTPDAAINVCVENSECLVVPQTCCGSCGAATRGDAVAVSRDELDQQRTDACAETMGCPACFAEPDPTLIATCRSNRCELVDLLERDEITACIQSTDCRLRFSGCCACASSDTPVIATRADAEQSFTALSCDSDQACPECAPVFDPSFVAECTGGRCQVAVLLRTLP